MATPAFKHDYDSEPDEIRGRKAVASKKKQVLLVGAEPRLLNYMQELVRQEPYLGATIRSVSQALVLMQQASPPEIALVHVQLFSEEAVEIVGALLRASPKLSIVVVSCFFEPQHVARAARLGAVEFVLMPFSPGELKAAIRRGLSLVEAGQRADEEYEIPLSLGSSFVFASQRMREIRVQCATLSRFDIPVLILGESGTGKEVLAQFIHKTSPRAHRSFLKVNCAAMPADLLESELFGYEQGAFTGATHAKPGKFELCNHGTILLDEIGEMPPSLQAKLLQVVQDGSFARLGGRASISVDVRVLAATNIDIKAAIAARTFRQDLYYRLNGFTVQLPSLRERKEEIPILLRYFMRKMAEKYSQPPIPISERMLQACMNHNWPGNLRELESFVKRFLVLGNEEIMLAELAQLHAGKPEASTLLGSRSCDSVGGLKSLTRSAKGEVEMEVIQNVLEECNWSRRKCALKLEISYKALLYKIRQYGLVPPPKPGPNKKTTENGGQ